MPLLMLKDLPRYECLLGAAKTFPDLDPSACEVFLHLLRAGDEAFALAEKNFHAHGISQGRFGVLMLLFNSGKRSADPVGGECFPPGPRTPAELAEAAGIDAARLPDCLAGGHADSSLLRKLYPRIQQRDFDPPNAYTRQLLKDLKAVMAFAGDHGCSLPLVAQATARFAEYAAAGNALTDPASLIRLYEAESSKPE